MIAAVRPIVYRGEYVASRPYGLSSKSVLCFGLGDDNFGRRHLSLSVFAMRRLVTAGLG